MKPFGVKGFAEAWVSRPAGARGLKHWITRK